MPRHCSVCDHPARCHRYGTRGAYARARRSATAWPQQGRRLAAPPRRPPAGHLRHALQAVDDLHAFDLLAQLRLINTAALQVLAEARAARALDLALALDPVRLAERAGFTADPWQAAVLRGHALRLVSISEDIDTTTPDGEMLMGLLMQFSQHQSRVLAKHVAKAKKDRVRQGLSNGNLPFSYRRCNCRQGSEGRCRGHAREVVPEALAGVQEAFGLYATGAYTAGMIAQFLNERGFRTRNTRKDAAVGVVGPRPFGMESVVDMLRNPFYALCRHGALPGRGAGSRCA